MVDVIQVSSLLPRRHVEGRAALRLEALLAAAVRVTRLGRRLGPALGVAAVPTGATATSGPDELARCYWESLCLKLG